MTASKRTGITLSIALASALAFAGAALAAPAGDEYLPKVPSASGHSGGGGGGGDGVASAAGTSAAAAQTSGADESPSKPADQRKKAKKDSRDSKDDLSITPAVSTDTGSSDGGGSPGLLIGLLIVVGVIIAAVGMTLRQRSAGADEGGEGAEPRERPAAAGAPRTPDGEIVAGRDKA